MDNASREAGASDAPALHDKPSWRPKWLLKILIEVAFITVGVFLALMGEQWRERAHARELAHASLERFRTEIANNRKAIEAEKSYRANLQKSLQQYGTDDPKTRRAENIQIQGLRPVFFEHTAWDLALATQSLADIDPDLAAVGRPAVPDGMPVARHTRMRIQALLVAFAVVTAIAPVHVQSSPDPSGEYRCNGISADGRKYLAAVHIVRNEDTFVVRWLTPNGVVNVGVGFVAGNKLSVGYVGASAGVVVYTIDGKTLTGEWTDIGAVGRVYKETLTKLADGETIVPSRSGPLF